MKDKSLSYPDAVKTCLKSRASMQVVENFVLPMILPVKRKSWIKDFNSTRPGENVTERCIGVVKLESDNYEYGTTSCDENHTVVCDASGADTAMTLMTREEMERLVDIQTRLASNQPQADDCCLASVSR
ncbi:hypothetical protein CHS0354_031281 [Potamilus streckersoni]|uniref:Uncharacterized protein n=1 Tax=Potamilus streckersoni TaxID=2493646 RepID=A0AAE0TCM6_9BIVA|nr:hypothetical protein CHS0354_031281 [Potamilus streckersoni]